MPVASKVGRRRRRRALSTAPDRRRGLLADLSISDLIEYEFERSPRMSSYLVAFIIGELDHVSVDCAVGGSKATRVSVYATPDRCGGGGGWGFFWSVCEAALGFVLRRDAVMSQLPPPATTPPHFLRRHPLHT